MVANAGKSAGKGLGVWLAIVILVTSAVLAAGTIYYLVSPPTNSKTTVEKDAAGQVTKTTTETQQSIGDAVLIAGFGFTAVLMLMLLSNGRFKLTAPGGAGIELVAAAVATSADQTIAALVGPPEERAKLSTEQQEAVQRWNSLSSKMK